MESGLGAGTRFREGSCSKTQALGTRYRREKRFPALGHSRLWQFMWATLFFPEVRFAFLSPCCAHDFWDPVPASDRAVSVVSVSSMPPGSCMYGYHTCIAKFFNWPNQVTTVNSSAHSLGLQRQNSSNKATSFPIAASLMLGPIRWKTRDRI